MEFTGKSVLLSGSATSVGFASAQAFLEAGAQVMINSNDKALLDRAVGRLAKYGDRAAGYCADIRNSGEVAALVKETVDRFGGIDILVNSAVTATTNLIVDLPEDEWDRVVDTNLKGPFLVAQAVARVMLAQQRGNRIINIGSTGGRSGRAGVAHYCASKAGLHMFTQVLALELGPHGITANAIACGMVLAEDKIRPVPKPYVDRFVKAIPLGYAGEPNDIAGAVLFLASPQARYITGEIMTIDGGTLAGRYFLAGG